MKKKRREMGRVLFCLISGILVMVLFGLVSRTALAQTTTTKYPTRPITFVCTYAAGGGSDSWLRTTAIFIGKQLPVPIVVTNQPGASGLIQLQNVMKNVPPDGYTVSHIEGATVIARATGMAGPDMRSSSEVTLLGCGVYQGTFLGARADSKYKTFQDFVADCKARPGEVKVSVASATGTEATIAYMMRDLTGLDFKLVPLGSAAAQWIELIAGRMDLAVQVYGMWQPYLGESVELSKRLRLLALSGKKRLSVEPNIPTFRELGYDITSGTFHGLAVHPDTPKDIVGTLVKAYRDAYQDPEYLDALNKIGRIGMFYQPPEEMPETINFYWKIGEYLKKAGKI